MGLVDRHSRLVAWAKVTLPLAALVLLSVLFLVSGRVDPKNASLYSDVDVAALARQARVGAPQYSTVTQDGSTLMVRARTAWPGTDGNGTSAQDIVAKMDSPDGLITDLAAQSGRIDPQGGPIHLFDGVAMRTSSGYRMRSAVVDMSPDYGIITAPQRVDGQTPMGPIEADQMQLSRPAPDAPYDMVFKGNVKLVYQPKQ
ncbi:MAG TPA: hypothetical protein VGC40_05700 [Paenirhodobacter sp.]